jgi:hypothetical protein
MNRGRRGEKLEEIGKQLGISKYSSVSGAVERTKRAITTNAS